MLYLTDEESAPTSLSKEQRVPYLLSGQLCGGQAVARNVAQRRAVRLTS